MIDWLVTIHYDPGTPTSYVVLAAPTARDARSAVLRELGYHPGVDIACSQLKAFNSPVKIEHDVIAWAPLNTEEKEMVRYNG